MFDCLNRCLFEAVERMRSGESIEEYKYYKGLVRELWRLRGEYLEWCITVDE